MLTAVASGTGEKNEESDAHICPCGACRALRALGRRDEDDTAKLVEDSDQAFENNALDTIELWAAVKSNENVRFNLEVKGEAMSSQKVSTTIGIHAVGEEGGFGTSSVEWEGTSSDADTLTMQEALAGTQNRVFAGKITFSMDAEDFAAATAADDYSADITLTATTIE